MLISLLTCCPFNRSPSRQDASKPLPSLQMAVTSSIRYVPVRPRIALTNLAITEVTGIAICLLLGAPVPHTPSSPPPATTIWCARFCRLIAIWSGLLQHTWIYTLGCGAATRHRTATSQAATCTSMYVQAVTTRILGGGVAQHLVVTLAVSLLLPSNPSICSHAL